MGLGDIYSLLILLRKYKDIAEIYLYIKDPCENKYKYFANEREALVIKQV